MRVLFNPLHALVFPDEHECEDYSTYCDFFESNGECQQNPAYMRMLCRDSCDVCNNNSTSNSEYLPCTHFLRGWVFYVVIHNVD